MIDPEQLKPLAWNVAEPMPGRKLLWFCRDTEGKTWVEVAKTEQRLTGAEVMGLAQRQVFDHCGPEGEIVFAGDSNLYQLLHVDLAVDGVVERTLVFDPSMINLDQHILIRIITLPASPESCVPAVTVDRRVQRGVTLATALKYAEGIATLAAKHGGIIAFSPDPGLHLLDRVEVYYDGQFQMVIPLDYSSFHLGA